LTEKNARAIVRLLVTNGVKAGGDDVPSATVQKWAAADKLEGILAEGLKSAEEKGWIESGPRPGTIKLTKDGSKIGNAS
jgi:hypothetical protein